MSDKTWDAWIGLVGKAIAERAESAASVDHNKYVARIRNSFVVCESPEAAESLVHNIRIAIVTEIVEAEKRVAAACGWKAKAVAAERELALYRALNICPSCGASCKRAGSGCICAGSL